MSSAKPKAKKQTKGFLDQEKYTAELTSWQLVSGVIILIVFGTACFALGVLVGKFEPSPRPAYADAEEPEGEEAPPPVSSSSQDSEEGEGVQESPRIVASRDLDEKPSGTPTRGAEPPVSERPLKLSPGTEGPRPVTLPPVDATADIDGGEAPSETEGESAAPAPELPPMEPEVSTPDAPETSWAPVEPSVEPDEPEEDSTPSQPAPSSATPGGLAGLGERSSGGPYAIQLVALSNQAKAEQFGSEVEKRTGLPVELSSKGSLVIVLAGRFPDKKTADEVRGVLHADKAYTGCFVTRR